MPTYYVTPEAEEDFLSIWRYTAERWGVAQANRYLLQLKEQCEQLHEGSVLEKQPLPAQPQIWMMRCEHHYLFYVKHELPVIIAVFHTKMDVMTRLAGRLGME